MNNITFIKKNKNYFIKEGIMTFTIKFTPFPNCNCNYKNDYFCKHVIFYLNKIKKIPLNCICFIENKHIFDKIDKLNISYENIKKNILEYLNENECGICLEKLSANKIYFCNSCKNITHEHCIKKWKKKNNKCIYCNSIID